MHLRLGGRGTKVERAVHRTTCNLHRKGPDWRERKQLPQLENPAQQGPPLNTALLPESKRFKSELKARSKSPALRESGDSEKTETKRYYKRIQTHRNLQSLPHHKFNQIPLDSLNHTQRLYSAKGRKAGKYQKGPNTEITLAELSNVLITRTRTV